VDTTTRRGGWWWLVGWLDGVSDPVYVTPPPPPVLLKNSLLVAQAGALRRPLGGGRQQQQQGWVGARGSGSVQAAALAPERPASVEDSAVVQEIEAETVALKPSSREEQARVSE
jgi:hypothetical protein